MKKNILVLIFIAVVTAIILLCLFNAKGPAPLIHPSQLETAMQTNALTTQAFSQQRTIITNENLLLQEPPRSAPPAEWGAWEREMDKRDPYWQYKLPISFYGKVIDEVGQPISGANIAFSWTDLSQEGTSQQNALSDTSGLFSLTGVTGKSLTVQVSKEGYKLYHSSNRSGFDFSSLSMPERHYSPDPHSPVQYVMRKNGLKEPLIQVNRKFSASTNQPTIFNLGGDDSTSIKIELLQNNSEKAGQSGAWSMRINVPNGGVQVSTNEFPFEAPETGYETEIRVDRGVAKPETWPNPYLGGEFFIKVGNSYGRLHLQMIEGSPHLSVISYFNPSGSRNLEP